MKHWLWSFLQVILPCAVIFAVLPYGEVVAFSAIDGAELEPEEVASFSIIELDEIEEAEAFKQAKTGMIHEKANVGLCLGGNVKADLLMRELGSEDFTKDISGIEVVVSRLRIDPVIFDLGIYRPSLAADKSEELPMVKPFKENRMPAFSRAELLRLPNK